MIDTAVCATIPGWFSPPRGLQEVIRCYGAITVSGGGITTPGWESANMISVHETWLPKRKLYVNKKAWPIFKSALEACLALGDGYPIRTLGCFAPRNKRVNGDLSLHSWAVALDLNADANPLQSPGGLVMRDIPDAWVNEFERRGCTWGGRFSRSDPMHFQHTTGY